MPSIPYKSSISATFQVLTSPQRPGKYKISNNTTRPPPRGSDDPVPVYGIPPDAGVYAHCAPPD